MSSARTSVRAQQRALREAMGGHGMSHRQIAAEFGRRYRLRPRAAWRHAHGWSLLQAAESITAFAAHAGIGTDGATVAMTGPHLCETEHWPGYGAEPAGRRPTPYLLSLLAAVYGCDIADLLDLADYEHMRPADHLVISTTSPAHAAAWTHASGTDRRDQGTSLALGREVGEARPQLLQVLQAGAPDACRPAPRQMRGQGQRVSA